MKNDEFFIYSGGFRIEAACAKSPGLIGKTSARINWENEKDLGAHKALEPLGNLEPVP